MREGRAQRVSSPKLLGGGDFFFFFLTQHNPCTERSRVKCVDVWMSGRFRYKTVFFVVPLQRCFQRWHPQVPASKMTPWGNLSPPHVTLFWILSLETTGCSTVKAGLCVCYTLLAHLKILICLLQTHFEQTAPYNLKYLAYSMHINLANKVLWSISPPSDHYHLQNGHIFLKEY